MRLKDKAAPLVTTKEIMPIKSNVTRLFNIICLFSKKADPVAMPHTVTPTIGIHQYKIVCTEKEIVHRNQKTVDRH